MDRLFRAVESGDFHFLKQRVTPENVNRADFRGFTLLHAACEDNMTEVAKWLIDCNANVNFVNYEGDTPLKTATGFGSYECVVLLIKNGADPTIVNRHKRSALHAASYLGRSDILELLLRHYPPRGVFEIDVSSDTCLIDAVNGHGHCDYSCVEILLKWGSNVEYVNERNWNALTYTLAAFTRRDFSSTNSGLIIKLLIDYGARLENAKLPVPETITSYAETRKRLRETCFALLHLRRKRSRTIQRNGRDLLRLVAQHLWSQRFQ